MSGTATSQGRASGAGDALRAWINSDRFCPGCGYNLKGLMAGGRCPECGRHISTANRWRATQALGEAPAHFLIPLAVALVLVGAGGLAQPFITTWFLAWDFDRRHVLAALIITGAYLAGILVLVRPRPRSAREPENQRRIEWPFVRLAVVLSQAAWMGIPLIPLTMTRNSPDWILEAPLVCIVVGTLGAAPLAVYLARLADWATDSTIGWRMTTAAAAMAIVGPAAIAIWVLREYGSPVLSFLLTVPWAIANLIVIAAYMVTVFTSAEMAFTAIWAVANTWESRARDARRLARESREAGEMAERTARAMAAADAAAFAARSRDDPAGPRRIEHAVPGLPGRPVEVPRLQSLREPTLQPRKGVRPYRVEE